MLLRGWRQRFVLAFAAALAATSLTACLLDGGGGLAGTCNDDSQCETGHICVTGECVELRVDGGPGIDAGTLDAGSDAGPPPTDAGTDSGPDIDSGTDAGADPDAGSFDPRSIPDLILWLRADNQDLGPLADWIDESGAANSVSAVQPTPATVSDITTATDSVRVVTLDGTSSFSSEPFEWGGLDGATILLVSFLDLSSAAAARVISTGASHVELRRDGSAAAFDFVVAGSPRSASGVGEWHLWTVSSGGGETILSSDELLVASVPTQIPMSSVALGLGGEPTSGARRMTGALAEILIYNRQLDAMEADEVRGYLNQKWRSLF